MTVSLKETNKRPAAWLGVMPFLYLALAILTVMAVARSGLYPAGGDAMYHIHRSDLVYDAIRRGLWWPAYDKSWYNGVEIMRYWPPVGPYFMAACQWLAGGDTFNGYLVFVGLVCYLGAFSWLYIGCRMDRPALGAFLGAMWFFVPNNLFALFGEGNLSRAVSMIFLPLYLYHVMSYLWTKHWRHLTGTAVFFALMAMCHVGYAGMLAIAVVLYLLLYEMLNRGSWHSVGYVLAATAFGFGMMGIWVLPSLFGGIANVDSSETMSGFFQSLRATLTPLGRQELNTYYFGLSVFVLAVLGVFLSRRKSAPGFLAGVLICLLSSTAAYPLLSKLPGGQYFWMLRFISIAVCMCLLSLLKWETLKKPIVVIFCLLFALDSVSSLWMVYGARSGKTPAERFDAVQAATLIDEAQAITTQRMCVLNEGGAGIDPYVYTTWGNPTDQVFGAGWQAATTSGNIVMLNRALNEGQYLYIFDRALEFGSDTLLVSLSAVKRLDEAPVEQMDAAAERLGYNLMDENGEYRLYHLNDAPQNWGTVSTYHVLGIGSRVGMALSFPGVEEADSNNLNDYTFEQLSSYDAVYIGDFVYDDRAYAEDLIRRVSEAGTRVVIVADGIPEDRSTHNQSFLSVYCNPVTFSNGYPEMDTVNGRINADLFPQDHTQWRTVYIEGLEERWGFLYDNGLELDFYGTVGNENLVFIALNLPYFHDLTHDASVGELLALAMRLPSDNLPERRIVPLTVEFHGNDITVTSPEDGVNSGLAWHESFTADQPISPTHHFTRVSAGTTHITLSYPYLREGLALSCVSLILVIALAVSGFRREKWEAELAEKSAEAAAKEEEETQKLALLAQAVREEAEAPTAETPTETKAPHPFKEELTPPEAAPAKRQTVHRAAKTQKRESARVRRVTARVVVRPADKKEPEQTQPEDPVGAANVEK